MDWFDFFFGMIIGTEICEAEYKARREAEYDRDFEEYVHRRYLAEKKFLKS